MQQQPDLWKRNWKPNIFNIMSITVFLTNSSSYF